MSAASGPGDLWSRTNFTVVIDGVELGCRDVRGLGSTSAFAPGPGRLSSPGAVAHAEPGAVAPAEPGAVAPAEPGVVAPAEPGVVAPAEPAAGTQAGGGAETGEPPALTAGWARLGTLPGMPRPPLTAGGPPARLDWVLTPIVVTRALDGDRRLYDWRANIVAGLTDAREVLIRLLDAAGGVPVQGWRLQGAWPWSWSGPELDAVAAGLACERVELVYESLQWLQIAQTGDA